MATNLGVEPGSFIVRSPGHEPERQYCLLLGESYCRYLSLSDCEKTRLCCFQLRRFARGEH